MQGSRMTLAGESISGLFRGICVDNKDPEGLGRIRVQVPQVLGAAASGWAFPAWSFHDLTVWPEDRLPKPGDGVWIMFESTSPDKMIWVAAFGPVDLINQPPYVEATEYESTLTLSVPSLEWNAVAEFTGVLGSLGGGGVPNPNPEVFLEAMPDGGEWTPVASTRNINPVDGSWSITYQITIPGSVQYRASFPGIGVYAPTDSTIANTDVVTDTSISDFTLPTLYHGTALAVSGEVSAETGERVIAGQVELKWRQTQGGDQAWKTAAGPVTITDGSFTLTAPPMSVLGGTEWQVVYTGGAQFGDSSGAVKAGVVNLRPIPAISKGGVSYTSVAGSWSAISGALGYDLERQIGSGGWAALVTNMTQTSFSNGGLSNMTNYYYRVRPRATDPDGAVVYGTWSPTLGANTGRPEIRDSGTSGNIDVTTTYFRSWRDQDADQPKGWQSWMRQARPADGVSANYNGLAIFGNNAVKNAIISALGGGTTGTNRQAYGTCYSCEVNLYKRDNNEQSNRVTINFRVSESTGGDVGTQTGGNPWPLGTMVSLTSSVKDASKWYDIGTAHGQKLGDNTARSIYISHGGGPSQYASFSGTATLRVRWTWNYATQTYVAPKWL